MKIIAKLLVLIAASFLALSTPAHAQLETYDTRPNFGGSVQQFNGSGPGSMMGQTIFGMDSVASMTYNFFTSGTVASPVLLNATFGEWNAGTESIVGATSVDFGTIIIPASVSWTETLGAAPTYKYEIDLRLLASNPLYSSLIDETQGYATDSSKTYAMMLTNLSGAGTGLALGSTATTTAFAFGQAYVGDATYFKDFAFAEILAAPHPVIPESSTVAAILGCVLVAGLVGFRLRQQRQQQLAPVAATIA